MAGSFDSLSCANALIESGFSGQQSQGLAKALWELIDSQLVTKADLAAAEERLSFKLAELRSEFKLDLAALKEELTMRMLGVLVLQAGITALLFKLLH